MSSQYLCLFRNSKPSLAWFKDAYLKQNHFCLKSLLTEKKAVTPRNKLI